MPSTSLLHFILILRLLRSDEAVSLVWRISSHALLPLLSSAQFELLMADSKLRVLLFV